MGHTHSTNPAPAIQRKESSANSFWTTSADNANTVSLNADKIKVDAASNNRKKFIRLGTIRRKLTRSLRTTKNSDYRKHIRDLLQTCSIGEIKALIKEYEGLEALNELTRLSNKARPSSVTMKSNLEKLYNESYCCDMSLQYKNDVYKVHSSILYTRCKMFTKYLPNFGSYTTDKPVVLDIPDFKLNEETFSSLLKYVYSGYTNDPNLVEVLSELGERFGMLNGIEHDMKTLLDGTDYADLILVFRNKMIDTSSICRAYIDKGDDTVDNTLEISCHAAVLCARSAFFKSLLLDKFESRKHSNEPMKLVLSEKIIPRPYIKVILNCFYTDTVVLDSIIKWKLADDGSGEADRLLTTSELAMELYEIGQFLECPILMQGCEDVIITQLNVSSLLGVLEWSSQPFGSISIHRQAMQFFQDEFYSLCKTSVFLANIPKKFLLHVIKSDFLQANEEFILTTLIKWGEWQVVKSNEKPGTSPANSLLRRSPKRRDINNDMLRETISDLLPHVRLKHILPPSSSTLHTAYQRNLLQRPFPFDVVAAEKQSISTPAYWLRERRNVEYLRPRLFVPYVYEAKLVLHERLSTASDQDVISPSYSQIMPDMLLPLQRTNSDTKTPTDEELSDASSLSILDLIHIDQVTIRDMVLREKELKVSPEALKALSLAPDSREISDEVQLRVVREFGYPDEVACKIFQQVPDLIEESESSSNSSKQSTLSKVERLFKHEATVLKGETDDGKSPPAEHLLDVDVLQTTLLQSHDKFQTYGSYDNPLVDNSPVRSVEDSPLDLPLREQQSLVELNNDLQLPNVLLDT